VESNGGRLLVSRKFEEAGSRSNTSTAGVPDPPSDVELRREAHVKVSEWLFKVLLPWEEVLRVTFFDDDAYLMDRAAARFKDGDAKGALDLAQRGEAEARNDKGGKAKFRERAIYNLGVARMAAGKFEEARPLLQEARDMNPDASIFRDTLKECQRPPATAGNARRRRRRPGVPPARIRSSGCWNSTACARRASSPRRTSSAASRRSCARSEPRGDCEGQP
jgi:tetratricopeptide (TPR) repeat protein